jgi:Mrp family chromosome partitioning ATPase/uncharacterized protein involved in exopolysaccharide biosynthesis
MKDLVPAKPASAQPAPADYAAYAPQDAYGAAPAANPLRIGRLLHFLKRFWWLPILTLICALGAAAAYVWHAPATYVSYARMWETEKLKLPDGAAFTGDLQNYYGTQMELLQSGRLMNLAIARLQAANSNAIPRDASGLPLGANIKVKQQPKSTVFVLEATSPSATYSQAILDALMNEYLAYKKSVRKVISGDTLSSISEQVLRLERDLKSDQETLTAFTRTNNLAILQEEATTSGGYLARLKTQLSDLELEARLLDATAAEQTNSLAGTNSTPFPVDPLRLTSSAGASAAVSESHTAYKELELLKIQRAKLSRTLKPKHPKIAKLDAEIERGQSIAELYRTQSRDQLASARQAIAMKLESVRASIKEWEAKVVDYKGIIAEAERLKFAVTRSQSLYDRLVLMLQNVDISRSIDQETLAVLEPATAATRNYKKEISIVAFAGFAGLGLGLGLIFLIQITDDRFVTVSEVTDKFGDAIIGQVPEVKALRKAKAAGLIGDVENPHVLAESYRNLRSALLFFPVQDQRPKVLLITSPVPSEGKSTVATNLARTFAQGGARVLLIDADLRKGHLHQTLGLQKAPGLSDLLSNGTCDLRKYIQTAESSSLSAGGEGRGEVDASSLSARGEGRGEVDPASNPSSSVHGHRSSVVSQPSSASSPSSVVSTPSSEVPGLQSMVCSRNVGSRLDFISRGSNIARPGDAFLSSNWERALARWRDEYDFVVIDSPPVFAADDASTLAPKADGTLVVVRRRFSKAGVTKEALELLAQRQAKILGLVFNRADPSSHSYYYYKYPEYNNPEEVKA